MGKTNKAAEKKFVPKSNEFKEEEKYLGKPKIMFAKKT